VLYKGKDRMCLTVQNLFNKKDVILSCEDIFKVAKYAIENNILEISFDDTSRNFDYGIEGMGLTDTDYTMVFNDGEGGEDE
jgi:hypothetical protein